MVYILIFEKGYVNSEVVFDLQGQIKNDFSMFFKDEVEIDFVILVFVGMFMFMFIVVFDIIGLN